MSTENTSATTPAEQRKDLGLKIDTLMIDIDNSQLSATLALLEKIEAAAKSAGAALAAIGAAPAPLTDLVVGELVADETQHLILAELRKHTALLSTLCQHQDDAAARQDNANHFPPQRTAAPIPRPPQRIPDYDPATGLLSFPAEEAGIAAA